VKLLELEVSAFGALAHRKLDLKREGPVVHVIYGPNEAGKSTTLRAILGLFYGIEHQSPDAKLFGADNLRISARLRDARGGELIATRVKGRKTTLRGADDEPLDEAKLSALLGDIPQSVFRTMFGLDHQRLREGGEQLRKGKGALGESLFQAGIGGAAVHRVLLELKAEADALFKPAGRLPALNEAIRAYREAGKRVRDATTRAESFRVQQEELEQARARGREMQLRRQALLAEQGRLGRVLRALPGLAKRRDLAARRAELEAVVFLPEGAAELRLTAQAELDACRREVAQLKADVAKMQARRDELDIPRTLSELHPEVLRGIRNRLGNHLKALQDLPRRRAELRRLEGEATATLRELGNPTPLAKVEALRIDRATHAHVTALGSQHGGLHERVVAAVREVDAVAAEVLELRAQLQALPPPCDRAVLEHALSVARALGDADTQAQRLRSELALEQGLASTRLAALPVTIAEPAALERVDWPSEALVAAYRQRFERCDQARAQLDEARAKLAERDQRAALGLRAIEREGAPPTEQDLSLARAERAAIWQRLRAELGREAAALPPEWLAAYENARQRADEIADRLRREARRVSQLSALITEREGIARDQELLAERQAELDRTSQQLATDWQALWAKVGMQPRSPLEMSGLLSKIGALIELSGRCEARARQLSLLERQAADVRSELDRGIRSVGQAPLSQGEGLSAALVRAERALRGIDRLELTRSDLEQKLQVRQQQHRLAERRRVEVTGELQRWDESWAQRMTQLRLRPDASVQEAMTVLEGLRLLFVKIDEMRQMRGRIEAMEEDAKQFRRDVAGLMDRHLFQLRELVVEEAAEELIRRYDKARTDLQQRSRIEADLSEAIQRLTMVAKAADSASERLADLQRMAGVLSSDALQRAEQRSDEARALQRSLAEVEDELLRHGEGASLTELASQAAELDRDRIRPRLLEIESELEELDESYKEAFHQAGRLEQGLHNLEQDERAAEAASDAEQHMSKIKRHAHSYVRSKLAAEVLGREIRRYRDENQGPIVGRASELFARLTLGQHQRLHVGFASDDEPVLLCIDAQGRQVQIEALSDGARDQLYLSLRLSSLERFAQQSEPLPLLLDDVLIHFDDDRARAALTVLGEFAATTQVLFFTHHGRLLELARQAIGPDRLVEHQLPAFTTPALLELHS
jgi:uncharacterized protein YhaN